MISKERMMRTILLASVAAAALAAPAWALPDRFEGQPGCIGASGVGCTQQATLEDDGNRTIEKEETAIASTEGVAVDETAVEEVDTSRATLARTSTDDEDLDDEIGDVADDVGDRAEEVGDDIADAAEDVGDAIDDAADDVGDAFN